MKVVLPFDLAPECIAYQNKAFPLGAIKANIPQYDIWLANKLINCEYYAGTNCFGIVEDYIWSEHERLVECQHLSFSTSFIREKRIDIIDIVKSMLKAGYYLYGNCDDYYIPGKSCYQDIHFIHDYFLYGYDEAGRFFHSAGYLSGQKFEAFPITYDDYFQSVLGLDTDRANLGFTKVNKDYVPQLSLHEITTYLKCYLNNAPNVNSYSAASHFGAVVWEFLASYIDSCKNTAVDMRAIRTFMEHKNVMLNRMNVLQREGFIQFKEEIQLYQQQVVHSARSAFLLCLKYNMTGDEKIRSNVSDVIKNANQVEMTVLTKLMAALS